MERCEKMAFFSVIVPVYNAAHTIERCVSSIAASGGEDVQIILVEDCARDNSWEVCRQLAQRYSTVTCLRNEKNRGVSHTRNRGLDAATGDYLLFVDSVEDACMNAVAGVGWLPCDRDLAAAGTALVPLTRGEAPVTRKMFAFWLEERDSPLQWEFVSCLERHFI